MSKKRDVVIDKGIPLPRRAKYPFQQMEVGDSFLIPGATNNRELGANLTTTAKRYGHKYASRRTEDGMRVWRVA